MIWTVFSAMAAPRMANCGGEGAIRDISYLLGVKRPLPSLTTVPVFKHVAEAANAMANERPWTIQRRACFFYDFQY
jgi:hypothetical protein